MRALILPGGMMLWSAAALPQDGFIALDRNGDGSISRVEALANPEIHKRFAAFDADKDGLLSGITARVKAALLADTQIPSKRIAVETYEGRVLLKGFVDTPSVASRAGRVTAAVEGVRTVHNDITVK